MEHICASLPSHINKFLANTHILNSKQHGFRQGLSCQTQLIEAVNDWVCSLNSKRGAKTCQITIALFDFCKAFDRVCHKRLSTAETWFLWHQGTNERVDWFIFARSNPNRLNSGSKVLQHTSGVGCAARLRIRPTPIFAFYQWHWQQYSVTPPFIRWWHNPISWNLVQGLPQHNTKWHPDCF